MPSQPTLSARRVLQGEGATCALQGLLGAALRLTLVGWTLSAMGPFTSRGKGGRRAMLPVSNTSSGAAVAAIVAGGNLEEYLLAGVEWMSDEQPRRVFPPGTTFWLGYTKGHGRNTGGRGGGGVEEDLVCGSWTE